MVKPVHDPWALKRISSGWSWGNWSCENTAFTEHAGFFQYNRLLFGLTNAPASFQRFLEHILWGYIGKFVILYIIDILIFSSTFEDHLIHVAQLLQTPEMAQLKIRNGKYQFARNSVQFLGHLVSSDGVGSNKRNAEAFTSFSTPAKIKVLCAFLNLSRNARCVLVRYSNHQKRMLHFTGILHNMNHLWFWKKD